MEMGISDIDGARQLDHGAVLSKNKKRVEGVLASMSKNIIFYFFKG